MFSYCKLPAPPAILAGRSVIGDFELRPHWIIKIESRGRRRARVVGGKIARLPRRLAHETKLSRSNFDNARTLPSTLIPAAGLRRKY